MYVEDLDLCWRLHRHGWQIRFDPTVDVPHVGNASGAQAWGEGCRVVGNNRTAALPFSLVSTRSTTACIKSPRSASVAAYHTSSNSRTYRVHSLDGDSFPWGDHLNGLVPEKRDDGWWYFDIEQVRAAKLRPFPNYFAHWVDCIQYDRDPVTPGEEGRA